MARRRKITEKEADSVLNQARRLPGHDFLVRQGTTRLDELKKQLPTQVKILNQAISSGRITKEEAESYLRVFAGDVIYGQSYPSKKDLEEWVDLKTGKISTPGRRPAPYTEEDRKTWLKVLLELQKMRRERA